MIADENDTIIALGWMFSAMQVALTCGWLVPALDTYAVSESLLCQHVARCFSILSTGIREPGDALCFSHFSLRRRAKVVCRFDGRVAQVAPEVCWCFVDEYRVDSGVGLSYSLRLRGYRD